MDTRGPERLISVDVADPADDRLIEQNTFDRTGPAPHRRDESGVIERGIQWVASNVLHLRWHFIRAVEHESVHGERAEGALVGEDDGKPAVRRVLDTDPNPFVPLRRSIRNPQQHLPAHPEM